jgi:hypothetical protein
MGFLQSAVISSLLNADTFLKTLFSDILSL